MIVYFTDRNLKIKGQAATGLSAGLQITRDLESGDVETGAFSFEFTVLVPTGAWAKVMDAATPGNLCIRSEGGVTRVYQILETATDSVAQTITCHCEDGGLQLLGNRTGTLVPSAGQEEGAAWYLGKTLEGTAFAVGEVTVDGIKRVAFDSETTCVERLLAIAEAFGGELVYTYSIDQVGGTVTATVGLVKKRGKKTLQRLYVGRQIKRLETRASAAGAATEIVARGGIPAGWSTPVTLKGYTWAGETEYGEDGSVIGQIALDPTTGTLHSDAAQERWGATITRIYEGTATTKQELLTEALADLKARRDVKREYEVELLSLADGTEPGDAVAIIDDDRGLYVEARLLSVSQSVADNEWSAVVGEARLRGSGLSARLETLAEKLNTGVSFERRAYVHIAYASSSDGVTGFSRSTANGLSYIGKYTDGNPEGLSDPSLYIWEPVAPQATVTSEQLFDYPVSNATVGGEDGEGGTIRMVDANGRIIGRLGEGGLIVYDAGGNVIGIWTKNGLTAYNGDEWMRIRESILEGGYGQDRHGFLDLSAQTGTAPNIQHDVALRAENQLRLEAGGGVVIRGPGTGANGSSRLHVSGDATVSGTLEADPTKGMLKFIWQKIEVNGGSVNPGDAVTVSVDLSDYIPAYYDAQAVLWEYASYYSDFAPVCIGFEPGGFTVDVRVRNIGDRQRTLSYVTLLIICTHL